MHPVRGDLPVPCVPVWVTSDALVAHRFTYEPPRCRTTQCRMTFLPLSETLWNDLAYPVFDSLGLLGFKNMDNSFLFAVYCLFSVCLLLFSLSLFFLWVGIAGLGSSN